MDLIYVGDNTWINPEEIMLVRLDDSGGFQKLKIQFKNSVQLFTVDTEFVSQTLKTLGIRRDNKWG